MNDVLLQKIQSCQRCIGRARAIYEKHQDGFTSDYDAQDAAVLNLIRVCEISIDIANFLVRRDQLGIPASSAESFSLLERAGKIDSDIAQRLKAMTGFRNVAVHQYRDLDMDIVVRIIQSDLGDVIAYLDQVVAAS